MFRKIVLYLVAFAAIGIYLLAANPAFMRYYTNKLTFSQSEAFRWNREKYGDLYSLSYLRDFRITLGSLVKDAKRVDTAPKENDIYIIGDSYLAQINAAAVDTSFYKSALAYYYYPNAEGGAIQNVTLENNGRKKILIFERTERFLFTEFKNAGGIPFYIRMLNVTKADTAAAVPPASPAANPAPTSKGGAAPGVLAEAQTGTGAWADFKHMMKFHFDISVMNQNIETLIYGYGLVAPVKEAKADFNYRLFNRANSGVVVAPDKQNLYMHETVDPHSDFSSFKPISDIMIDTMTNNLERIAQYYKDKGFDEVVFSFIPNAVSVGNPELGTYNELLRRIQSRLKFPYIDVIDTFSKYPNPKSLYRAADTHWNSTGYALWVDGVNAWLRRLSAK